MTCRQHDKGYKLLFSHPEFVKDLVCGFLPDDWLKTLDWNTLERQSGHYVSDDMRERLDDVIWRVRVNDEWAYLYLLIEFQSDVDLFMPVRVMTYTGLLYQDLIRQNSAWNIGWWREGKRLPIILPIVLYNGGAAWTTPVDMQGLLPQNMPEALAGFMPSMKFWLLSERDLVNDPEVVTMENLLACIMRIEHPGGEDGFRKARQDLSRLLAQDQYRVLARSVHIWLYQTLKISQTIPDVIERAESLEEMDMHISQYLDQREKELRRLGQAEGRAEGLAEGLAEGRVEGLAEGFAEGRMEGERLLLLRLLSKRFGTLSAEITDRVQHADIDEIHAWFDQSLISPSLEDIFGARH